MVSKQRIRSAQRGAQKYDRAPKDQTPDYQNFDPILRTADKIHLGSNDERKNLLFERVGPLIESYKKGGLRKSSDIARALNKQNVTTAIGEKWTPRLVWFLQKELYEWRKMQEQKEKDRTRTAPRKQSSPDIDRQNDRSRSNAVSRTQSSPNINGLTDLEMAKRKAALEAFLKR